MGGRRAWLAAAGALVALALVVFFTLAAPIAEGYFNRVQPGSRPPPSERAHALHSRLTVVDLHADSLLWGRDLLERGRRGHVDVPRLLAGNVALQGFTIVTKTPRGLNIDRNDDRSDQVRLLALAQRWPLATLGSLRERALHQARRLETLARRSAGRLTLVRSREELAAYLERRRRTPGLTAGFLGIEGAHALDGELAGLEALAEAGVRMIGLTHFFDNELGGSAHGVAKGGLTPLGRELIRRMEARGILLDLAHAAPSLLAEAVAASTHPVVVSHTGVRGTCDNPRNLSDEQLRLVAGTGGVVGIGFWETAVCGPDAGAIARAIRHAAGIAGVEHVALGSDFDGAVTTPFDTSGMAALTDALLAVGFSEDEVAGLMGGNALRVLSAVLPRSPLGAGATPPQP
jgi:microsomal dipeptidase-like Zn-dependent dipeptidase